MDIQEAFFLRLLTTASRKQPVSASPQGRFLRWLLSSPIRYPFAQVAGVQAFSRVAQTAGFADLLLPKIRMQNR